MAAAIQIQYEKDKEAEQLRFQKPKQIPYPMPPKCNEQSCANYRGQATVPKESYWLCKACTAAAPSAYDLGYARRPLLYYSNVKPWGPQKRAEWTTAFNASVLLTHIRMPP